MVTIHGRKAVVGGSASAKRTTRSPLPNAPSASHRRAQFDWPPTHPKVERSAHAWLVRSAVGTAQAETSDEPREGHVSDRVSLRPVGEWAGGQRGSQAAQGPKASQSHRSGWSSTARRVGFSHLRNRATTTPTIFFAQTPLLQVCCANRPTRESRSLERVRRPSASAWRSRKDVIGQSERAALGHPARHCQD